MDTTTTQDDSQLFQHAKRPEWGFAVLAWEGEGRRAFQFEDGKLRIFAQGFYHLMDEVDAAPGNADTVVQGLQRRAAIETHSAASVGGEEAAERRARSMSLADQRLIFDHLFEKGFEGPRWSRRRRGLGSSKTLKRHREPAAARTRELLAADALRELIDAERPGDIVELALRILSATDLVTSKQCQELSELPTSRRDPLGSAIFELLHDEAAFELRLERFIAALLAAEVKPTWQLVTVLPALMEPERYVCVRPSCFRRQAEALAPRLRWSSAPSAPRYEKLCSVAADLRDQLREKGYEPRDFLDIYDFMWLTLRPAAEKTLDEVKANKAAMARGAS